LALQIKWNIVEPSPLHVGKLRAVIVNRKTALFVIISKGDPIRFVSAIDVYNPAATNAVDKD